MATYPTNQMFWVTTSDLTQFNMVGYNNIGNVVIPETIPAPLPKVPVLTSSTSSPNVTITSNYSGNGYMLFGPGNANGGVVYLYDGTFNPHYYEIDFAQNKYDFILGYSSLYFNSTGSGGMTLTASIDQTTWDSIYDFKGSAPQDSFTMNAISGVSKRYRYYRLNFFPGNGYTHINGVATPVNGSYGWQLYPKQGYCRYLVSFDVF